MDLLLMAQLTLHSRSNMDNRLVSSNSSSLIFHLSSNHHPSRKLLQASVRLACLPSSQIIRNSEHRNHSISRAQVSQPLSRMDRLKPSTLLLPHHSSKTNFSHRAFIHHLRVVLLHAPRIYLLRRAFLNVHLLVRHQSTRSKCNNCIKGRFLHRQPFLTASVWSKLQPKPRPSLHRQPL